MGVYIKGVGMPKSCSRCPMLEGDRMDGLCHAASRWLDDDEFWTWYVYPEGDMDDSKPCNCPLVPVPEHGRLIDADALEDRCSRQARNEWNKSTSTNWGYAYATFESDVEDAPTIIPAEGGE